MLHFCSTDDIKGVMQSAPRFDATYETVRKGVTEDMNKYMRRTLDYEADIVEYFDAHDVEFGGSFSLWLAKKNIEAGTVIVSYEPRRIWDDANVYTDADLLVDLAKGKITVYGRTRTSSGSIRVQYSGGFKQIGTTDVMDAPSTLREKAIAECSYRLDKLLNVNVGQAEDVDKKQRVVQRKFIGNLLWDTAMALNEYRKPLGA